MILVVDLSYLSSLSMASLLNGFFSWLQSILDSGSHTLGTVQACRFIVSLSGLVTTIYTLFGAFILPPPPVVMTTFSDTPSNPCWFLPNERDVATFVQEHVDHHFFTLSIFGSYKSGAQISSQIFSLVVMGVSGRGFGSLVQQVLMEFRTTIDLTLSCLYPRQLAQSCFSSTKRLLFSTESFRNLWQVTNRWFSPHRKQ